MVERVWIYTTGFNVAVRQIGRLVHCLSVFLYYFFVYFTTNIDYPIDYYDNLKLVLNS